MFTILFNFIKEHNARHISLLSTTSKFMYILHIISLAFLPQQFPCRKQSFFQVCKTIQRALTSCVNEHFRLYYAHQHL
ncbi:hypothetical protein XELAEV_18021450mg [Xenopus laevis]|uniref:Uncharacterized protein n=1 Tax=Xenopus laevis TaxID=8355 RepID=A0A974HRC9_XENLA|nr:hypothetical protein XELAEV_18021450mg [Xenopus laevis]